MDDWQSTFLQKSFWTMISNLQNEAKLCDIVLYVKSKRGQMIGFPAHKVLLVNASSYFKTLFENENMKNCCHFPDLSEDSLSSLLDIIYGREMPEDINLEETLSAARFLQVTMAVEMLEKRMPSKRPGRRQQVPSTVDQSQNTQSAQNSALVASPKGTKRKADVQLMDMVKKVTVLIEKSVQTTPVSQSSLTNSQAVGPAGVSSQSQDDLADGTLQVKQEPNETSSRVSSAAAASETPSSSQQQADSSSSCEKRDDDTGVPASESEQNQTANTQIAEHEIKEEAPATSSTSYELAVGDHLYYATNIPQTEHGEDVELGAQQVSEASTDPEDGADRLIIDAVFRVQDDSSQSTQQSDDDSSLAHAELVNRQIRRKRRYAYEPIVCNICGKDFPSNAGLAQHVLVHTGIKPFKCSEPACGMKFTQLGHLIRHRRKHTGERPFRCEECGQMFTQDSSLKQHRLLHTGEKPYDCKHCGRQFTQVGNLRRHLIVHEEKELYRCDECPKVYKTLAKFDTHMLSHRKEQEKDNATTS